VSQTQPIFWHQGMFLQPHHFQQSEKYISHQIDTLKQNMAPWMWGFINLDVAEEAVQAKRIKLHAAELFLEDGTYIEIDLNAYVAERSIEGAEIDPESPTTVYLALKQESSFSSNVTKINDISEANTVKTRYFTFVNPTPTQDRYVQGEVAETHELILKLDIILDSEKEGYSEYTLIPFAQITMDGENLTLAKNFIPPCLNIQASQQLSKKISELKDELAGRAIQLKVGQAMLGSQIDNNSIRYQLSLQALSRYVPRLNHEVSTPNIQPWMIYGGLKELIGEISTFNKEINLLGENQQGESLLPDYKHTNSGECFNQARNLINQILNEISVGPQFLVNLDRNEQSFSCDIPKDFFKERADFYLIINSTEDWDTFSHSFFTTAKLSSKNTIDVLIERSLPGIGLIHSPTTPAGLPKKDGAHYVRIDVHDDEWLSVERQENLVLHWDDAPEDLMIELVILKR